jgi:glycosyltransferase involved in cell wall biosynthesis
MKILILTEQIAPFQIELAEEINKIASVQCAIAFGQEISHRGNHWESFEKKPSEQVYFAGKGLKAEQIIEWYRNIIAKEKPDAVICNGIRRAVYQAAIQEYQARGFRLGFWLEQPLPKTNLIYRFLRFLFYKRRIRNESFVLAIGDRAARFYHRILPHVALVPYGQDLSSCFSYPRQPNSSGKMRFLFSGQLIKRHNINLILSAFAQIYRKKGDCFSLVLAGHGPEEATVNQVIRSTPDLARTISYDRDYQNWNDRLQPFRTSDVLVYPSQHSGWGLVIPEAMAFGLPVITTQNVEAGRYYVQHGVNGAFVNPDKTELERVVTDFLGDPLRIFQMGQAARESAKRGHSSAVAQKMVHAIGSFL